MHNDAVQLAGMTLVGNLFPQFVHCIHYQELMNCQGRASLALPDPLRQPVIAYKYERPAREGLGHYRTAFCSGPTGTRVGDNWLISSFEVGDAHVRAPQVQYVVCFGEM